MDIFCKLYLLTVLIMILEKMIVDGSWLSTSLITPTIMNQTFCYFFACRVA